MKNKVLKCFLAELSFWKLLKQLLIFLKLKEALKLFLGFSKKLPKLKSSDKVEAYIE